MRFNDLVQLADGIADSKTDSLNASLSLFKELAKRTLTYVSISAVEGQANILLDT